jgi:hypothetical protein
MLKNQYVKKFSRSIAASENVRRCRRQKPRELGQEYSGAEDNIQEDSSILVFLPGEVRKFLHAFMRASVRAVKKEKTVSSIFVRGD